MIKVKLGRKLNSKQLEEILIQAGKDMGWRAKTLYSVCEELEVLSISKLYFRGWLLPKMQISGVYYGSDEINIWSGYGFGYASKKEIKGFLEKVSEYISQ